MTADRPEWAEGTRADSQLTLRSALQEAFLIDSRVESRPSFRSDRRVLVENLADRGEQPSRDGPIVKQCTVVQEPRKTAKTTICGSPEGSTYHI